MGAQAASQGTITGTASVIDGDTIEIHGERIKLHAIDAIESRQKCRLPGGREWRCGTDAANTLAQKIDRSPVECRVSDTDRYGRFVAKCYQKGEDLNAWLVANGWAVASRQYGRDYATVCVATTGTKPAVFAAIINALRASTTGAMQSIAASIVSSARCRASSDTGHLR